MIVKGSINYSPCGRKRKVKRVKKTRVASGQSTNSSAMQERLAKIEAEREKYPSLESTAYTPQPDTQYKNEVSKRYTVAIAYNKGGYQVIGKDNIKDIGK
tara:strand:+ start:901 stop:1200 length:300 start_codon:yes stop_codon:yes gene_type:complete